MRRNCIAGLCLLLAAIALEATPRPAGIVVENVATGEEAGGGQASSRAMCSYRGNETPIRRRTQPSERTLQDAVRRSGNADRSVSSRENDLDRIPAPQRKLRAHASAVRVGGRNAALVLGQSPENLRSGRTPDRSRSGRDPGTRTWRTLAGGLAASGDHLGAAWIWLRTARKKAAADRIDAAVEWFDLAIAQARAANRADVESQLWGFQGEALAAARRFAEGEAALRRAIAIREQSSPDSLAVAYCLEDLIKVTEQRGAAYEAAQTRALRIRETLAPGSAVEAGSLAGTCAFSTFFRGDLRTAVELQRQALAIHRRIDETGAKAAYAVDDLVQWRSSAAIWPQANSTASSHFALSSRFPGEVGLDSLPALS